MSKIAVVGGGPGGLMIAHRLERRCFHGHEITLFEAASRVGGKIRTYRFDSAPALYEGGVAECYDYSGIGPDPLRALVEELGLHTRPISGHTVVLDGCHLRSADDIRLHCGSRTLEAIEAFRRRAASLLPLEAWRSWDDDGRHPWARRTCEELLDEVSDPTARRYLEVAVHSDLATEPRLTSGLNGLKNFVMDVPGYVGQYSIDGGMENLPRALLASLASTRVELEAPVSRIERTSGGDYRVVFRQGGATVSRDFDAVVVALPHNWLGALDWGGERLRRAMARHLTAYDRPGHYLRVSLLFEGPFWRGTVEGNWFMLDAFGGCCVYDEGSRHDASGRGVLSFLLAGDAARSHARLDDPALIQRVLDSLPGDLHRGARETYLEGRVHRWARAVSGLPGGFPARPARPAHLPEPVDHPGLLLVGDYLYDSTLNGVCESAMRACELLEERLRSVRLDPDRYSEAVAVA